MCQSMSPILGLVRIVASRIYAPPLQTLFSTSALPVGDVLILACFPFVVWGSDELWRLRTRIYARQGETGLAESHPTS